MPTLTRDKGLYLEQRAREIGLSEVDLYACVLGYVQASVPDDIWVKAVDVAVEYYSSPGDPDRIAAQEAEREHKALEHGALARGQRV